MKSDRARLVTLLAAMQDSDMEGVLKLSQKMIEDSIPPKAMTVRGALLASSRLKDREKAVLRS